MSITDKRNKNAELVPLFELIEFKALAQRYGAEQNPEVQSTLFQLLIKTALMDPKVALDLIDEYFTLSPMASNKAFKAH